MSELHFSPRPNRAHEIHWREWGDGAFEEARAADKPVLLAISAVWCHWCHVMDETTYSARDVIDLINERYIPIRVDNDRRPDVNARYNQGGWPTTALLTPAGDLLRGATYVPPDQMQRLLEQIAAFYADPTNRSAIEEHVLDVRRRRGQPPRRAAGESPLERDIPERVFSFLDANFDETYGGFGSEQKFPQTSALHFLLDRFARRRDARSKRIVGQTLHAMAGGGMYDRVYGGFYRYSTTRDFTVPHFEKMLEDLAGLLSACARAAALFDDAELARIAIDVRSYMDSWLWNESAKAYGGSQDADEAYYALDADARSAAKAPYVDPTVYTSWNAEAALALLVAGPLLERFGADADEWTRRGMLILESLCSRLRDGLMCRYEAAGAPQVRGLLGDQAWTARALLGAYEATGSEAWLERARALAGAASALYEDEARAYADRLPGEDGIARLGERNFPLDENALMGRALMRLSTATGEAGYRDRALTVLESFAAGYRAYGMFASAYAAAVMEWFDPPLRIEIVETHERNASSLREAARCCAAPPVFILTAKRGSDRATAPGRYPDGDVSATVCDDEQCFARATSAQQLTDALSQAASRY